MPDTKWTIHGKEFANCNCSYGCPCQFNAPPTHGNCWAVVGIQIESGHHGDVNLDGLRVAGIFKYPGAIHMGNGEAVPIVDQRANAAQRDSLLRIMSGQDTDPFATMFAVYASTLTTFHDPVFTAIELDVDVDARKGRVFVRDYLEVNGEPIRNKATGAPARAQIVLPEGFEYAVAVIGSASSRTQGPVQVALTDTYGQFANLHLNSHGVVRA